MPGSIDHSVLLSRIATRGGGQMPPLDTTVLDTDALNLFSAWITNCLPGYQTHGNSLLVFSANGGHIFSVHSQRK